MKKMYNTPEVEVFEFDAEIQMQTISQIGPGKPGEPGELPEGSANLDNIFNLENSGWE